MGNVGNCKFFYASSILALIFLKMKFIKFFTIQKIAFFINFSKNFLYLQDTIFLRYFCLPNFCVLKKKQSNVIFLLNSLYVMEKKLLFFFKISFFFFLRLFKSIGLKFYARLTLRGNGWNIFLSTETSGIQRLELRLGFTKSIFLSVPSCLCIYILKGKILIEGLDKSIVRSFANLLREYKKPNIYTGKGFWKYREKILLRSVKKAR